MSNLGVATTQTNIMTNQVILAFSTSLAQEYMLGGWIQGTADSINDTPVPMGECSTYYSNDDSVMALLYDGTADTVWCIDPAVENLQFAE